MDCGPNDVIHKCDASQIVLGAGKISLIELFLFRQLQSASSRVIFRGLSFPFLIDETLMVA